MKPLSLSAIPFSGLGHGLEHVVFRARLTELRTVEVPAVFAFARPLAHEARASGYGLLLNLSREIRGR